MVDLPRAALLTGRNHHSAHMGTICEIAYGLPGYDSTAPGVVRRFKTGCPRTLNGYWITWPTSARHDAKTTTTSAGPGR